MPSWPKGARSRCAETANMALPLRHRALGRLEGRASCLNRRRCPALAIRSQIADPGPQLVRLQPEILAAGGLKVAEQPLPGLQSFGSLLENTFLPVKLSYPGMHILNIDPPVMSVKDFLSAEDCEALIQGLLRKAVDLLGLPPGLAEPSKVFSRPEPGQLTFELPQIAHYMPGQHFLAHEDAFPVNTALEKGYQRRATLLCYLNDVPTGGSTYFECLDMGVQPTKGTALLFFPSFAGGRPDSRTLHTAQDAVDEKWMTQLWVSGGLRQKAPSISASNLPAIPFDPSGKKVKRKKKNK